MGYEESEWLRDPRYARGIELFNSGQYFECHEVLEEIWTVARGGRRLFLQALIHCAVAMHHYERANANGARLQMGKALKKLAGYLPIYGCLDTLTLYRDGIGWRDAIIAGERISGPRLMRMTQALQSQVQR